MVGCTLTVEEGLAHQWLNLQPLVWLGTISYSVYVWQQFFLLYSGSQPPLGRLNVFPASLLCVLLISLASYHLVERRLIALGRRLR